MSKGPLLAEIARSFLFRKYPRHGLDIDNLHTRNPISFLSQIAILRCKNLLLIGKTKVSDLLEPILLINPRIWLF